MKRHFVIMYLQARGSVRCFVEESVTVPMYHQWCAARRGETNYCLRNAVTLSMCTLIPTVYRALLNSAVSGTDHRIHTTKKITVIVLRDKYGFRETVRRSGGSFIHSWILQSLGPASPFD